MARTTQALRAKPPASIPALAPVPDSPLPAQLRFPLLVVLSMTLSSLFYSFASPFTSGDLATVSRSRDQWWEVAGLLGWKTTELAVGWYGKYDSSDLAALTFLSHIPYLYFLMQFYSIQPLTVLACITIDTAAAFIPFYLLRISSSIHSIQTPKGVAANRSVINDFGIQASTSLLAASIYGVVVISSFGTWLPVYLVTHFDGIRDISAAHSTNFPYLVGCLVPVGFAAKVFLFTPATAAKPDALDKKTAAFDPETATLGETVLYNVWGFSKRSRIMIARTATLVAVSGLHTWLQTYVAVEGAEGLGAAGWSSVWSLAAALTGTVFWWIGDVEGMSN